MSMLVEMEQVGLKPAPWGPYTARLGELFPAKLAALETLIEQHGQHNGIASLRELLQTGEVDEN